MKNVGIIIQARKGSTRLPNKMVLPFYENKGILELLLIKIKSSYPEFDIILATTVSTKDDELEAIARKHEVNTYRGSEQDVLDRFINAANVYKLDTLIRVCADNPFLDVAHISSLIDEIQADKTLDYVSYEIDNTPSIKTHLGLFTEAVRLAALKKVDQSVDKDSMYREHVTNFIYANEDVFKIKFLTNPLKDKNVNRIRLTLDTQRDFDMLRGLFSKYSTCSSDEIIDHLKNDSQILEEMSNLIEFNQK